MNGPFDSRDCAAPNCPREADPGSVFCAQHPGGTGIRVWHRPQLVAAANDLRGRGLTRRKIAAELGVSLSALHNALNDPDGSKQRARRDGYAGVCVDCGTATQSDGTSQASPRCPDCAAAASIVWTAEKCVEAIQEFARRYGAPPTIADLAPALARQAGKRCGAEKAARYEEKALRFERDGCWPWGHTLTAKFGSFQAALRAAGFEPNARQVRWSRDLIVALMHDWELEHGAPPTYNEWLRIDPEWPCVSVCAHHFGNWGNALEAAGYQRPHPKGLKTMRVYYVLHKNGDQAFHAVTVEAHSPEQAIEKVADSEGEWVAVLDRYWVTATVATQTKLAVVKA